jgi:phosphoglucosamine mutase
VCSATTVVARRTGHRALIGRDTRVSGDFLSHALAAGMSAGGFDVIDAGIIPTPGVAFLTSVLNVEMGAVIFRLAQSDARQRHQVLRARWVQTARPRRKTRSRPCSAMDWERPTGAGVGRVSHDTTTATNLYIDHLVSAIAPGRQRAAAQGLNVVADWR